MNRVALVQQGPLDGAALSAFFGSFSSECFRKEQRKKTGGAASRTVQKLADENRSKRGSLVVDFEGR